MLPDRYLAGTGFGLLAYGMWGFFPLFFRQLSHVAPLDILSNRAVWGCIFVSALLTLRGQWRQVATVLATSRQFLMLVSAALLIGTNWLVFLWAVADRQVLASSLGYFLTPVVNIALGMLFLKERLNRLEAISLVLGVAAVANEVITVGALPWISLVLAGTFGTYGLVRKQLPVDAVCGLWLETLIMLPVCAIYGYWQSTQGHPVFSGHDVLTTGLLIAAGALTALPLLAFAAAAQRLDLATLGMLMYVNPTLQLVIAVRIFGEATQPSRLLSFALIWLGLFIFSCSAWRKYRLGH